MFPGFVSTTSNPIFRILTRSLFASALFISATMADTSQIESEFDYAAKLEQLSIVAEHQQFVDRTVSNFLEGINAGFEDVEMAGHIDHDYVILARQVAEGVYSSDRVLQAVHEQLQSSLKESDYAPLISLLDSDIRKRERAAEESARLRLESEDGTEIFDSFVETYRASDQFVERSELIRSLHETLRISELMAQLLIDTQTANVIGLSYTQPAESRASLDVVIANIRTQQPTIEKLLRAQFANHQAYIYRGFNTDDIKLMTELYSSAEYKRYFAAVMHGLRLSLTSMSIEFGDRLGAAMAFAESSQEL